jgi:cellulose synthase/poly-beta-1,6-N-acetylglucosamine synthase-like glycosyltransferase
MVPIFSALLTFGAAIVALVVAVFLVEVVAALTLGRRYDGLPSITDSDVAARITVLVPAHNESAGLLPTLDDINRQLRPGDRILVVADNCTDDTAPMARTTGAEVIERHDPAKRGKGYALDFGIQHLSSAPPDILIIIDADCRIAANSMARLTRLCARTRRPVQALYLMAAPANSRINHQVAEFAWRVKNWLRPLGLFSLGLPCQLMGTGMAFPWEVIRKVDLANGWLVEDLKLGLDLAAQGHPPLFCPSALVSSQFGSSAKAARTQRERWERGHISMIPTTAPRLFCRAAVDRNWNLIALTLDLAVPPLSLLAMLVIGIVSITAVCALLGLSLSAFIVSGAALTAFVLAAFLAWLKCGRDVVPIGTALSIPLYILGKLGLYRIKMFNKRDAQWVRTDRAESD